MLSFIVSMLQNARFMRNNQFNINMNMSFLCSMKNKTVVEDYFTKTEQLIVFQ